MRRDLDVFCVCCLQFLSEMRVRLQNLDHLSEVPVVVQAGVLQGQQRAGEGEHMHSYRHRYPRTEQTHSGLLLFGLLLDVIAIDGNRPDPDPDRQEQQRSGSQPHPPAWCVQHKGSGTQQLQKEQENRKLGEKCND